MTRCSVRTPRAPALSAPVSSRGSQGLSSPIIEPKEGRSQEGRLHQLCEISLGLIWRSGAFPLDISVDYRGVEKFDLARVCLQSA